ncbi:MAG: S-layer homology domain-containing protein [Oscillospiraceae bacterium]|nr:S-layer homology domain-containing protein [Oscillospiraceae bacterium]
MSKRAIALMLLSAQLLSATALAAGTVDEPSETVQSAEDVQTPSLEEQDSTLPENGEDALEDGAPAGEEPAGEMPVPPTGPSLLTDEHIAYMSGSGSMFRPSGNITRGEAAQILYRLLPEHPDITVSYSDVSPDSWYGQAALELGSLGVIRPNNYTFMPKEELTRAEFISYLAAFFPPRTDAAQFTDVPDGHPNAASFISARAWGWLNGFDDGSVHPDQPVTRAEAAALINRALGRSADRTAVDTRPHPAFYWDVAPSNWYYYDVMEATVAHEHTVTDTEHWTSFTAVPCDISEGLYLRDGWLCYYSPYRNDLVRNDPVDSFDFNEAGHFTSGNAGLDAKLRDIVLTHTTESMTQEQKLRALYIYTRDSFTYLRRPAYAFGVLDFMQKDALNMLNTGYGNCYCYASVFWYLARWIGYDAKIYSGTVGSNRQPHSWVEIEFSGKSYIFDTELEMAYHKKGRYDINLYKYIDVDGWRYIK